MSEGKDPRSTLTAAVGDGKRAFVLGGVTYQVGPATLNDLAALQTTLELIWDRSVSAAEVGLELGTPRGLTFLLWSVLHRDDPELELKDVRGAIQLRDTDAMSRMIEVLDLTGGDDDDENPQIPASD